MSEAIITRSGGGGESGGDIIVIPTHHSILVTVYGNNNSGLAVNYPLSCKDGTAFYNYTTNTKGQVLFMVNSGAANILASNNVNNVHYIDVSNSWTNIDAPVGQKTILNIVLNKGTQSIVQTTTPYLFASAVSRNVNIALVGAGGGGGAGVYSSTTWEAIYSGAGGAGGYLNWYNNYTLNAGEIYNFIPGSRGAGATSANSSGGAGGTSYIVNKSMSATGGGGGGPSYLTSQSYVLGRGGKGGTGNGGNGGWYPTRSSDSASWGAGENGGNSPVSFAGGGGATGRMNSRGGTPYGANATFDPDHPSNATGMGGGGAGSLCYEPSTQFGSSDCYKGGWGYNGGMRIEMKL